MATEIRKGIEKMMKLTTMTMKRMVLTGAAVAVMMSFAAPAMANEEEQQLKPAAPITEDLCDKFPLVCDDPPPPPPPPPPDPPNICDRFPILCSDDLPVIDTPDKVDPVIDPPVTEEPPVADPPDDKDPVVDPGKDDADNEESDTSGPGGSSGGGSGGGSGSGSVSETVDRGGTLVSSFVPTALTNMIGEAGNSMKENLPASVAKSLPNTGGGWSFLLLVAVGLIAGGFLIRSIASRTSSVTRTAQ